MVIVTGNVWCLDRLGAGKREYVKWMGMDKWCSLAIIWGAWWEV